MNKGAFHSSGRLDVQMLINRFRVQRFVFEADSTPFTITSFTWQLNIKANEGSYNSLLTLSTGGHGLSFPIYETNVLEARFQASQVNKPTIDQGQYYWELVRTDTNEIWVSGHIDFMYGLLDSSGEDQDVTVSLSNNSIVVSLQSIVYVTGSGGGGVGTFDIVDYIDFETSDLPAGVDAGYIARLVFTNIDYTKTINGVQYTNNTIIYYNGTRWLSWSGNAAT